MTSTGCLITDPPQFNPPKHTMPFLVEATADPDPTRILTVDTQLLPTTQSVLQFSAEVRSQDDPSGTTTPFQQVEGKLYIDYGLNLPGTENQPFRFVFDGSPTLASGTLAQTGRRITASWTPSFVDVHPGCHTATLIVSHKFQDPPSSCPICADDFSAITWQILRCDRSVDGCKDLPVNGDNSCEGLTNSCALVRAKLDGGPEACPGQSDGGAP